MRRPQSRSRGRFGLLSLALVVFIIECVLHMSLQGPSSTGPTAGPLLSTTSETESKHATPPFEDEGRDTHAEHPTAKKSDLIAAVKRWTSRRTPDSRSAHAQVPKHEATRRVSTDDVVERRAKEEAPKHEDAHNTNNGTPLVARRHPRFPKGAPVPRVYRTDPSRFNDRQRKVIASMRHAWASYVEFAWGHDEVRPLSENKYSDFSPETTADTGIALTAIEALDTLWLMGLEDEFKMVVDYLASPKHTFAKNMFVSLFEVTIRALGGLLSAYELSGHPVLLDKANDLGSRLFRAFLSRDQSERLPPATVNLLTGETVVESWLGDKQSLSEVTTLQLEFRKLSYFTGDMRYDERVQLVMRTILPHVDSSPTHLLTMFVDRRTGAPSDDKVTLGARGDSFYEYLVKQWVLTKKSEEFYRGYYVKVRDAVLDLLTVRVDDTHSFVAEGTRRSPINLEYKMDHLVCFVVGMLLLGSEGNPRDIAAAEAIGRTCHQMYSLGATHLGPEIVRFNEKKEMYISPGAQHNIMRPEAIEAMFYLARYRPTNPDWREWGWAMYEAMENVLRAEHGYTGIRDVRQTGPPYSRTEKLESFFLAETLKYSFLVAADPVAAGEEPILPLDQWVFNTEAHPFRLIPAPPWNFDATNPA